MVKAGSAMEKPPTSQMHNAQSIPKTANTATMT
jgi:hypothetical protein